MKILFSLSLLFTAIFLIACAPRVETRTSPTDGKTMVRVPGGEFTLGVSDAQARMLAAQYNIDPQSLELEMPEQKVKLAEFWIDREPVTNAEYKKFLDANAAHRIPDTQLTALKQFSWDPNMRTFPGGREDMPVVLVAWNDAVAYCRWAGKRLPTEAEWEKAARGTDGRLYPWGNDWDNSKTAYGAAGSKDTAAVGTREGGASPYGANDMVANVWQWTSSLSKPYPYQPNDGREDPQSTEARVARGGMFAFGPAVSRTNVRNGLQPDARAISVGFRCAAN